MFNKLVLQDGELPRHPLVGFWQRLLQPKMLRESRFKVWTYWLRSLWKHLFVPRYYTPGPLFALFWVVSFLWTFLSRFNVWIYWLSLGSGRPIAWVALVWAKAFATKMTANARFQALRSLSDCWPLATVMLSVVERLVAGTGRNSSHTNDPGWAQGMRRAPCSELFQSYGPSVQWNLDVKV